MKKDQISVIIPVYNSTQTIVESMGSVVNEMTANSYPWELILINDGSTDDSLSVIQEYIQNSPFGGHIKVVSQKNEGVAVARNTGIEVSKGEFIAFNDSDDKWLPGKIKTQMDFLLKNPDVIMVAGIFGEDNINSVKKIQSGTIITIKDQLLKNYFSPQTTILRQSILHKSGLFNPQMRYAEEGYFFNNIVVFGKSVVLTEVVTAPIFEKGRWGDCGLSGNLLKMEQGELYNIRTAYRNKYVSFPFFLFAYLFSILKFVRRWILSKLKKRND